MAQTVKKLVNTLPKPREALVIPSLALRTVTSKSGKGVYASSDTLFKGAVFGRDSLEVAEDLLNFKPKLVRNILITLASLQGIEYNDKNEEEPGKIVHEYRNIVVDGKPISDISLNIFRQLSSKWGGNDTEMAYYGSIDATPHFLRVLNFYTTTKGNRLLDHKVNLRNGITLSIKEVASRSADWLLLKLSESKSGMLEYKKVNQHGISNQVWKDSEEFYVHETGEIANHAQPISSIEVQGLAYDALIYAGKLFPDKKNEYLLAAQNLRDRTIKLLWQPDREYFGLGTDLDKDNSLRIIDTMTANPAALLDTKFFDNLPPEKRKLYVSSIAKTIMSREFLTDAGIRSRALREAHLIPFWDYHGSYVTWPKETYDIAKGLRRQGMPKLARELENRLLNIVLKNREYMEFVYVDEHGRVLASSPSAHTHGDLFMVEGSNKPERIQAWTISAIISILNYRVNNKIKRNQSKIEAWQKSVEHNVIRNIPKMDLHLNPFALSARYPTYKYRLSNNKASD